MPVGTCGETVPDARHPQHEILLQAYSGMTTSKDTWKFDRTIPGEADAAIALITEMIDQLRDKNWDEQDVFSIHLALEEALMNAIKHGNQRGVSKKVQVTGIVSKSQFEITVKDEGKGFVRAEVPDPTDDGNVEKTSGRGLMLMEFYVSEVKYNDTGNQIRMLKIRSEEPSTN